MTDREVLGWVAQARRGDYPPFDSERLRLLLRDLGYPCAGVHDTMDTDHITAWVAAWLEQHPLKS